MGTIVLNAKRNNYKKLHCQKQPQGLFFEKLNHRIQLKIHRGMPNPAQAFTPIIFAKQSS